ncbi:MAG: alcohol dehydrogenase catalytic domain-containing protein [Rhizobiales bacterium]|nr:alcohol dehydrogenase catalytic domain-containing protein [Hyphomicrobiales bacterium]
MTLFTRQSLTAYAAPLCETVADLPAPQGTEVLVRVACCGVCHSDIHLQDGYFSLGGDRKLDITPGRSLPFTLGHEIAGTVEAAGPDANAKPGDPVAVFPWIGCGRCPACLRDEEVLCIAPRHLGVTVDGGYATHVLVPHPRYLLDYAPLPAPLAAAYMCSGVTAYSALKKVSARAAQGPVLIVGLGGVGMMALAFARTLFPHAPLVADIDPAKREAALAAGAAAAFDPADADARKALVKATQGGVLAACDFVGSDKSLAFANGAIAKGGKIVVAGLLGGAFTTPVPMFPLKVMTIEGTFVGSLAEAREMLDLARTGTPPQVPITARPLVEAQRSLDDLRAGRVLGRVVLTAA